MPPMDDSMGMEDPSMGGDMNSMPPMGEDPTQDPNAMGGDMPQDPSAMGDDGSMGDIPQQGQDQDDDEIMNIINSLSIEDKAAVEKYAKSMVDDSSDNSSNDSMPTESRYRSIKSVIDETISSYLYDDDDEEEYSIVGTNEADPFENKISNESPIAVAVMGKKEGDTVLVESPNGSFSVKIVKVA